MHSANPASIEIIVKPCSGSSDDRPTLVNQITLPLCQQFQIGSKLLGKETRRNLIVTVRSDVNIEPSCFIAGTEPTQGKATRRSKLGNRFQILANHEQPSTLFRPVSH